MANLRRAAMPRSGIVSFFMLLCIFTGCSSEPEIEGKKVTEWVSLLRHDDWSTQARASDILSRMGPDAVPYLRRLVRAKDPTLRKGVVITLAKIGPPAKEVVPGMLRRMKVEEVDVIRAEILKALTRIDPRAPGVKEEFEKRQRDRASEVRDAARLGLEALAPKKPEPKKPEKTDLPAKAEELVLHEAVAVEMKKHGVAFGLVAEVVRENRRAAIVWPAIKDGKILDDDIVAYVFEKTKGEKWKLSAGNIGLSRGGGSEALSKALGGADKQRVVRKCGVPRDQLPAFLEEKGKAFKEALAGGKVPEALAAYQDLTRAFSYRLVAFDDMLPELLAGAVLADSPWKFTPVEGKDTVDLEVQVKGKTQKGKLRMRACGDGWVIGELIL